MIQAGVAFMIGVTFDAPNLPVAAMIFNPAGPITGWLEMSNFDGNSYNLEASISNPGAYSIKKVVFTDDTFTTRDASRPEADDAIQVVNASSGGGGSSGGTGELTGVISNETLVGIVEDC